MQVNKRSFFTLLEMLVVLMILSMGAVLTGVKLKQAFQEQRVFSDVQQVVNGLRMAQDLMLLMDADTEVILKRDRNTKAVKFQINVEKPLSKKWEKIAEREITLSAIRSFRFGKREEDPLHISFSLGKMSQGTLILSVDDQVNTLSKDNKKTFRIPLKGYPSPIAQVEAEEEENGRFNYTSEGRQLYPEELYEELYETVNAKI